MAQLQETLRSAVLVAVAAACGLAGNALAQGEAGTGHSRKSP